jgi:hypothetical protein
VRGRTALIGSEAPAKTERSPGARAALGGLLAALGALCTILWSESAQLDARAGVAPARRERTAVEASPVTPGAAHPVALRSGNPLPQRSLPPTASDRIAVPGPSTATLVHPHAFTLECLVVDSDHVPVEDAEVFLGGPLGTLDRAGRTAADGRLEISWHGLTSELAMIVGARTSDGEWTGLRRVELLASVRHRIALHADASRVAHRALDSAPKLESGPHPATPFVATPWTRIGGATSLLRSDRRRVHRLEHVDAGIESPIAAGAAPSSNGYLPLDDPPWSARLVGSVRNSAGQALPGAWVSVLRDPPHLLASARAEDDGSFVVESLPPGRVEARARIGGSGEASATIELLEGGTAYWEPVLDRGLEVRGRVVDREGQPCRGWRIELEDTSGERAWCGVGRTDDSGSFAVGNCPARAVRLAVIAPESEPCGLPVLSMSVVPGEREHSLVLETDRAAATSVALSVLDWDGSAVEDEEIRIWQLGSDRGAWVLPRTGGEYELSGLAGGAYRIEIGSAARGWVDFGDVWVEAGRTQDLGHARLPRPGSLALSFEPCERSCVPELELAVYRREQGFDSLVRESSGLRSRQMALSPGRYVLVAAARGILPRAFGFAILAGEETDLHVPMEPVLAP